jgi:hypothetical protein
MSERERKGAPRQPSLPLPDVGRGEGGEVGADPREERLRVLCAAVYEPVEPSEALRRKVAEVTQLPNTRSCWPAGRAWALGISGAPAAGILTAALLLVIGLAVVWSREHRPTDRQNAASVTGRTPERFAPALHSLPRHALRHPSQQMAGSYLVQPGVQHEEILPAGMGTRQRRASRPTSGHGPQAPVRGDPDYVSRDPETTIQQWVILSRDRGEQIEAALRQTVRVRDDFVRIPFPQIASTSDREITAAVESYKREAAIVDPRLSREVTLQQKGTALSDVCEQLRADTGIQLAAGPSVADEKVTILCEAMSLREVMRQLSRPFGYTWLRSRKAGSDYRYELVQDLRSQLLEEELRNRDRNAALLALQAEIDRYRPYLNLSPDEALARARTASPTEKPLLEKLAGYGWGPLQMYFRLSPQDQTALRAGQPLTFSAAPLRGQQPLPPEIGRGVLQSFRDHRLVRHDDGFSLVPAQLGNPEAVPLTAAAEVRPLVTLSLQQNEPGQFTLDGHSGLSSRKFYMTWRGGPYAVGRSPAALKSDSRAANARRASDPIFRARVTLQPQPYCCPPRMAQTGSGSTPEARATTADALEALHRATRLPLVADYYTHLYGPKEVAVQPQSLFDALNQLADAMRLRWNKDGDWLQFRSAHYYDDRLKEVPNRLLSRWSAARQQHGFLTLDELIEIAQLPDAPLDAAEMAEGARDCFGLVEWDLARNRWLRPHLRYLAGFTPAQRQEAMRATGLAFTKMSLAQQQQFIAFAFPPDEEPIQAAVRGAGFDSPRLLEELKQGVLRVEYTQPGWFQWGNPALSGQWFRWVVAVEPGPRGRRVLRPPVRERTREAALQAVRRLDPQLREAAVHQLSLPGQTGGAERPIPLEEQIFPSELGLTIVYIPGPSNGLLMRILNHGGPSWQPSR